MTSVVPWETLEQQQAFLNKLDKAFEECINVYMPFQTPPNSQSGAKFERNFLPAHTIFAHVSSFFNAAECENDKELLRFHMKQHAFVEACLGTEAYKHRLCQPQFHSQRINEKYYMYPADSDTIQRAIERAVSKQNRVESTFSKLTRVIFNLINWEFRKDKLHTRYEFEHMVSKHRCNEIDEQFTAKVDRHNIGNCVLITKKLNQTTKEMSIIDWCRSTIPQELFNENEYKKRFYCTTHDHARGYTNPTTFETFKNNRRQQLYAHLTSMFNSN